MSTLRLRELPARGTPAQRSKLPATIMNKVSEFCGDRFDDDAALMIVALK